MLTDAQKRAVEALQNSDAVFIGVGWAAGSPIQVIKEDTIKELVEGGIVKFYMHDDSYCAHLVKEV